MYVYVCLLVFSRKEVFRLMMSESRRDESESHADLGATRHVSEAWQRMEYGDSGPTGGSGWEVLSCLEAVAGAHLGRCNREAATHRGSKKKRPKLLSTPCKKGSQYKKRKKKN